MAADNLKIIAYGKVMDNDEKSLAEYNIKEGDFMVVMNAPAKKPATAAKPEDAKAAEGAPTSSSAPAQPAPAQAQQPAPAQPAPA